MDKITEICMSYLQTLRNNKDVFVLEQEVKPFNEVLRDFHVDVSVEVVDGVGSYYTLDE